MVGIYHPRRRTGTQCDRKRANSPPVRASVARGHPKTVTPQVALWSSILNTPRELLAAASYPHISPTRLPIDRLARPSRIPQGRGHGPRRLEKWLDPVD